MKFVTYKNDTGLVTGVYDQTDVATFICRDGESIIEVGEDLPNDQVLFVRNGLVVGESAPSEFHVFNPASLTWDVSIATATSSAALKRNSLLQQSDWTQLPDVPLATRDAWATYRQALRDITDQPGYPLSIVWPEKP